MVSRVLFWGCAPWTSLSLLQLCVKPTTEAHPVTDHPPLGQNIWITQCPGIVISARPPRCANNTCLLFAYKTRGRQSCEQRDVAITSTDVDVDVYKYEIQRTFKANHVIHNSNTTAVPTAMKYHANTPYAVNNTTNLGRVS